MSGSWHVGDVVETVGAAKIVGRVFDYDALARGVRFAPKGTPPL